MNPQQFRDALQDFPTGVTVVTTADEEGRPLGATVSSFTSLSLEPPLVLVCLKDNSRTVTAARQRGAFAVHFLDRSQTRLARLFATDLGNKFDSMTYGINGAGVPCLDDCRKRLECTLYSEYEGGDHVILVGRVEETSQPQMFEPLVYAQRGYFGLGTQVVEAEKTA
jgi:flavin reductase (DIM6/NTAB) family NADH-FMN oxidoreductase RutF